MDKDELLKTLAELHEDLTSVDEVDPEAERLLRTVTDDIHRLLDEDRESPPGEDTRSLSEKLQSLMINWEADHPKIARMIGQTANSLANLGF